MAVSDFDDQVALVACAHGDPQALQRLYDAEASRMMALALHLVGQRSVAEELVADTFVLVWKNAESYDVSRGSARAWIYSILRYRALGRLRQAGRLTTMPGGFASFALPSALQAAAATSGQPEILKALAALPENARQSIYLAFYKAFDFQRIAQRFESSVNEVRRTVREALRILAVTQDGPLPGVSVDESIVLGEYTLGLLDPHEVETVHGWLAASDAVVCESLGWEGRFLALTDLLSPVQPSAHVYFKIQARLGHESIPAPATLFRQPESTLRVEPSIAEAALAADGGSRFESSSVEPVSEVSQAAVITTQRVMSVPLDSPPTQQREIKPARRSGKSEPMASRAEPLISDTVSAVQPNDAYNMPDTEAVASAPVSAPVKDTTESRVASVRRSSGSSALWKWVAAALAVVAVALWAGVWFKPEPEPAVTVVRIAPTMGAILQPPGSSSTPGWVVTLDHENNLQFRPLVQTQVASGKTVHLWSRLPGTAQSTSLGVINPNQPFVIKAVQTGPVKEGMILEMTLENTDNPVLNSPDGPILFLGQMVVFGAAPPDSPVMGAAVRQGS